MVEVTGLANFESVSILKCFLRYVSAQGTEDHLFLEQCTSLLLVYEVIAYCSGLNVSKRISDIAMDSVSEQKVDFCGRKESRWMRLIGFRGLFITRPCSMLLENSMPAAPPNLESCDHTTVKRMVHRALMTDKL